MIRNANRGLAAERQARLRAMLRERRVVRIADLPRELGVSPATARRDLARLERLGEARRVHGGAMSVAAGLEEPIFENKEALAAAEKQRIARAALRRIGPNECIFLDGGSTVLALARLLRDRPGLTVVTNSLRVAMELAPRGPRLAIVGGELRRLSETFVGPLTRHTIEPLHVDTAFVGTIGIAGRAGLTTTDPQEAYTKALVIEHARRVVLLADGTKAGRVSFARFGRLEDLDVLITDRPPGAALRQQLRRNRVEVVIA